MDPVQRQQLQEFLPKQRASHTHVSHIQMNDKIKHLILAHPMPRAPPGKKRIWRCPMCVKFEAGHKSERNRHLNAVHFQRYIVHWQLKLMFCKCDQYGSRGQDQKDRNGHYHCPECHLALQNRWCLRRHLIHRHGYSRDDLPRELRNLDKGNKKRK